MQEADAAFLHEGITFTVVHLVSDRSGHRIMNAPGVIQYAVRHVTRFTCTAPISESIMEVRMQPRTDGAQHCLRFDLSTTPRVRPFTYRAKDGATK